MIYEMRTYTLKPGMVNDYEARFAEGLPHREKYSKLGAFWHTEFGPLNQVVHVWPYDDLNQRMEVRAAANQDPNWPPKAAGLYVSQETEVFNPAPFMGPLPSGQFGNIYEMRIYTYEVGSMPEVLKRWEKSVPDRVKRSPLDRVLVLGAGGAQQVHPHLALQRLPGTGAHPR